MRLFWICITIIGAVILFIYLRGNSSIGSSVDNDQLAQLTKAGLLATVIAAGVLSSGIPLTNVLRNALIWAALIAVLIIGYNNRYQLQDIAHNVSGGLVPASIISADLSGRETVTIDRSSNGHYQIRGMIDGQRVNFLIDTGATSIVLTHETAMDLGINTQDLNYSNIVSTANGDLKTARVRLNSINIGSIARKNLQALIAPSGALSENLLGMNFINTLSSASIRGSQLILID